MSERISRQDLANMMTAVRDSAVRAGVDEAANWQLSIGSKLNGIAYRLWLQQEGSSAHHSPLVRDYLGMTAAEAFATLSTLRDAFQAVNWVREDES